MKKKERPGTLLTLGGSCPAPPFISRSAALAALDAGLGRRLLAHLRAGVRRWSARYRHTTWKNSHTWKKGLGWFGLIWLA